LYDAITGNFCVDKSRVFAAGESSGGDYSGILGCEHADKLRAIGPAATKNVNGYMLNASSRPCTGQVAAYIIHSSQDNVVGTSNLQPMVDFYRELNHCDESSTPLEGWNSGMAKCVAYDGCDEGFPVIWCDHSDPTYSNTFHGWPGFAGDMVWEQFSQY
jgi:poly(3-hydroxybutyrate) depolymerase